MRENTAALQVLSRNPRWAVGTANLRKLDVSQGQLARSRASAYGEVYSRRRGAMIVDVVASRQRRYTSRVVPTIERWEQNTDDPSLAGLKAEGIDARTYGLQESEATTIQTVAGNLAAFALDNGLDDDQACKLWASNTEGVEHAPDLDVVVGAVKGIGPALFAYARMRSGSSAIKVDVRVKKSLRALGFEVPPSDHATLVIAHAAASAIDVDLLVLDQLLWFADGAE